MAELWIRGRALVCTVLLAGAAGACGDDSPTIEILTSALSDVRLGAQVDTKVEVRGGTPPYRFSLASGRLPDGVMLKGETGQISGIAGSPGAHAFGISVKDSEDEAGSKALSLYVIPNALEVVTTVLPAGREGSSYSAELTARGGVPPYAWSVSTGSLPAGIALTGAGVLSGTPSEFGPFDFTAQVKDGEDKTASQALHLFVASLDPIITTSTVPKARMNQAYSVRLEASGGNEPYTWSLASGAFPDGLQLASTGEIAGTPREAGEFTVTVRVADASSRRDDADLVLRVIAPLNIETVAIPQALLGRPYQFQMVGSGGEPPYEWSIGTGALPDGITMSATGLISGTANSAGSSELTIRVRDAEGFQRSALFSFQVTDRYTYGVFPDVDFPPVCTSTTVSYTFVPIDVIDSMQIEDLDVSVDIGFGFASNTNLKVYLVAPDGTVAVLCGDGASVPGGLDCPGTNGFSRTFDDEGTQAQRPQRPLSAFDGLNPNGRWYLQVAVTEPLSCNNGTINGVTLLIRDDRSADPYVFVRGYTRNNLLLEPWVRITGGGLDQQDIYLSATAYAVGANGRREGGAGDDVPDSAVLTWSLTGAPISGTSITPDGHVHSGSVTGETAVTASGGGFSVSVPLYVTPPDWNPAKRPY